MLACALSGEVGARVHLVESQGKKAAFLREAIRAARVPAVVHQRRIEAFTRTFAEPIDLVTARALAPLPELLELAVPLLQKGAQALFLKGQEVGHELTAAAARWTLDLTLYPSRTDPTGRIVCIRAAQRRAPA